MRFLNQLKAMGLPGDYKEFGGNCFKKIFVQISETETNFIIRISVKDPLSWKCIETIIISNYLKNYTKYFIREGENEVIF